jgi:chromosome segregation ATPase
MSSKMSLITQTVEKIQDPTEDIQSYLRNQLSTLRADVLRYEEVSEDRQKTQQWNEQLHQQLETQKEQCAMLHESIRNSQQEAADVKAQYSSLQSELENWKGKSCNHDADPSEADKERDNLRKQLEKAKEDLREELTELGRVQQRLESQAEELTITKVRQIA